MAKQVTFKDENGQEQTFELRHDIAHLVDSVETFTDSDGVFFQRQLEAIETATYDVLYADLEARECFTTNTFGGAGAQQLTHRSFDHVGRAQVINARATDLPKSDISAREYTIGVFGIGVAYDYDIDEVAAAKMAGLPLEARKAMAAKRGYEEMVNQIVWFGLPENNIPGFFSEENQINRALVAQGASGSTSYTQKTPDEIIADLNQICTDMYAGTKKIHAPAELWMSVAFWNHIRTTPRSNVSDTTILNYFLQNNQFITNASQIKHLNIMEAATLAAETADHGVPLTGEVLVAIQHKSPVGMETIRIRETLPLQFLPVQLHGLVYEVPGRGRFAGLEVTYPRAIEIRFGL